MKRAKLVFIQAQQYRGPLVILLTVLVVYLLDQYLSGALVYQRTLVNQGEWWRLISAHLMHTNSYHLLFNSLALLLLCALQGHFYTFKTYLSCCLFSTLICGIGIHFFSPDIKQYVGLSGVLHGVFVWSAFQEITHKNKIGYILLLGLIAKISYEQLFGGSTEITELIEAHVAVNAHLWGAIGGAVMAISSLIPRTKKS